MQFGNSRCINRATALVPSPLSTLCRAQDNSLTFNNSPNDVFLEVGLCVVEEVLDQPPEEDGEGEQHEDPRYKPGREGGLGVFPDQSPDEEREAHKQNEEVEHCHHYLQR